MSQFYIHADLKHLSDLADVGKLGKSRTLITFNKAAQILKADVGVRILSQRKSTREAGTFRIEASETTKENLTKKLPGWKIDPFPFGP